jgi:hypothetical protein
MVFDPTKPVRTRGGLPATIVSTNGAGTHSIIAVIKTDEGDLIMTFRPDGRASVSAETVGDLVNCEERRTVFYNVYKTDKTGFRFGLEHTSEMIARCQACSGGLIGRVELTCEGGKLVSFVNHDIGAGNDPA